MSCSIENKNFQLHLDKSETTLTVLLENKGSVARHISLRNRLAQNPDINRLELSQVLRSSRQKSSSKSRNVYWAAMLNHICDNTANCNKQSAA